jgi:hypothetical protein
LAVDANVVAGAGSSIGGNIGNTSTGVAVVASDRHLRIRLIARRRKGATDATTSRPSARTVVPNCLIGDLSAPSDQARAAAGNDIGTRRREVDMQMAVLNAVRGPVISGGNQNGDTECGRVLKHLVHLLASLRTPAFLGGSPADRNHARLVGGIVNRGRNGVDEAAISVRGVVDGYLGT